MSEEALLLLTVGIILAIAQCTGCSAFQTTESEELCVEWHEAIASFSRKCGASEADIAAKFNADTARCSDAIVTSRVQAQRCIDDVDAWACGKTEYACEAIKYLP